MDIDTIRKSFNSEDYILLTEEYKKQSQRLYYVCPNGHKRSTTWKNWKRGNRCLICKNHRTKPPISLVRESFEKEGYTLSSEEYLNNKTKLEYICPTGHKNSITWSDWNNGGYRCPDCSGNKKLSIEQIRKDFDEEDYTLLSDKYINNFTELVVKCPNGHEFKSFWNNWQQGRRCPICYKNRVNIDSIRKSFEAEGYKLLSEKYVNAHTKLHYICSNGHKHMISWSAWQQGERCFYCRNFKNRIPINIVIEMFEVEGYTFIEDSYLKDKFEYVCPNGHKGSVTLGNWKTNNVRCPMCIDWGTSKPEKELATYIESLGVNTKINDRLAIKPKELDILISSKKIAIEYCGLYWHSELMGKYNDYHINKLKSCNQEGYKLITVFEDEWLNKNDIVKSRLKNLIGIRDGVKTLYARKLNIKEISVSEARKFCEENHLQGYVGSNIKLGAFDNETLVSIMTFSKPSISKGHKQRDPGVWELSRFCSKLDYIIVGIASKFLSFFKKNYVWRKIFSYADRRWSNGNVYEKIGFTFNSTTPVSYWYFANGDIERHHRFAFRKKPDEPKDVTEWELRKSEGLNRIWDCGNLKYVMYNN